MPVGRHRITAIRIRLYTVSCTPPVELPSQLCSKADEASSRTVPITGPQSSRPPMYRRDERGFDRNAEIERGRRIDEVDVLRVDAPAKAVRNALSM